MLAEHLEDLTKQFPDCLIAAFADIGTGITLVTAGTADAPREAMDELCTEAGLTLGAPDTPAMGSDPCQVAIKANAQALFIYLRDIAEPDDVLMFMCRPGVDLDGFLTAARACLATDS